MKTGLALVLLLPLPVFAATPVPAGDLPASATWTAAGSPYQLQGSLTVPAGVTLTLQAGTVVVPVLSSTELEVRGTIVTIGTATSPVVMGDDVHDWKGIRLTAGSGSSISHTDLRNTTAGLITSVSLTVTDSRIENAGFDLIDYGRCIHVWGGTATFTRVTTSCRGDGARIDGGRADVHDSVIVHDRYGFEVVSGATLNVDRTAIRGGWSGLYGDGASTFLHDTVTGCEYPAVDVTYGGNATVRDSILVSSYPSSAVRSSSSSTVTFDHNDVWGGSLDIAGAAIGQAGNIAANPAFVSTDDVHLTASSPCRGAGTNGSDLGAYPYSSSTGTAPSTITISGAATVTAGDATTLTATVRDSAGNALPSAPVTWSVVSGNGSIGASSGTFSAPCAPGQVSVRASSGTVSSTVTLSVVAGPATRLAITPSNPTLAPSGQVTFSAAAFDTCSNLRTAPALTWSASAAAGTMTGSTLRATSNAGSYPGAVTASGGGLSASTGVTVTASTVASVQVSPAALTLSPGQTAQVTVTARDAAGNVMAAAPAFSVLVPAAGTISPGGVFTAGTTAGSFPSAVRVTAGAASATVGVTIVPGPAARIAVSPASVTLAPGGSVALAATVTDAQGNARTDAISWSMAAPGAGSITSAGLFTAGTTEGGFPAAVRAQAAGLSATVDVAIASTALAQLTVTPAVATLAAGDTLTFSVTAKDSHGATVAVAAAWSVVRGGGTITSSGVFKAGQQPGRFDATVQATARGLTATATVVITSGPVVEIRIDPGFPVVVAREEQQFTAKGFDAFGNELPVTVEWSVDPIAGSIDPVTGVLHAGDVSGWYSDVIWASLPGGALMGSASVRIVGGESGSLPSRETNMTTVSSTGCGCSAGAEGTALLFALLWLTSRCRSRPARPRGPTASARPSR